MPWPTCPRCGIFLRDTELYTRPAASCPTCNGFCLDGDVARDIFIRDERHAFEAVEGDAALDCPRCKEDSMHPARHTLAPDVALDQCGKCGLLWFDAVEPAVLVDAIRAQMGIPTVPRGVPADPTTPDTGATLRYGPDLANNLPIMAREFLRVPNLLYVALVIALIYLARFMLPWPVGVPIAHAIAAFVYFHALSHAAQGQAKLFDAHDFEGVVSVFGAFMRLAMAAVVSAAPVVLAVLLVGNADGLMAQVAVGFFALVSAFLAPMLLIVAAMTRGFAVLHPGRWIRVLRAAPASYAAVVLIFYTVCGAGFGAATWLRSLEHLAFGPISTIVWVVTALFGFQVLGIWVHTHWDAIQAE